MSRRTQGGFLGRNTADARGVRSLGEQYDQRRRNVWPRVTDKTEAGWERPADWLAMPTVSSGESKFVGLQAVHPDGGNVVALQVNTATTTFTGNVVGTTTASSTDATSYTLTSRTFSANTLYLLSVVNSHASSATLPTISGATGAPTFTQRGTVLFNSNLSRTTLFSVVPAADFTGSLTVDFGGVTQTAMSAVVVSVVNIDTANNDGFVQVVTNTGNSGTASATLSSPQGFAVVYGAIGRASTSAVSAGTGMTLSSTANATTPPNQAAAVYNTGASFQPTAGFSASPWAMIGVELRRGNVLIDWGDGNSERTNTTVYHAYDYAALSSTTNSTRGYRQALVTITSDTPSLVTGITLQQRYNPGNNQRLARWLDIVVSWPTISTLTFGASSLNAYLAMLERVRVLSSSVSSGLDMFRGLEALQVVEFNSSSTMTVLTNMFQDCRTLRDAPYFNTAGATNMSSMFRNCYSMRTCPPYDFSAVTTMVSAFDACRALTALPVINSGVCQTFSNMASGCTSLMQISAVDTSAATDVSGMFANCYALKGVPDLVLSSATTLAGMFSGCYSLLSAPALNIPVATDISSLFANCAQLRMVPDLTTSSTLTTTASAFSGCYSLLEAPAISNTASVTAANSMFATCTSLRSVPLYNLSACLNVNNMFADCSSLTIIPAFNMSAVTNAQSLFDNASGLSSIPALDLSNATNIGSMFNSAHGISSLDLTVPAATTTTSLFFASSNSLVKLLLRGLRYGTTIVNALGMPRDAIEACFESLGIAVAGQTFTLPTAASSIGNLPPVSLSGTTTAGSTTVTMASTTGLTTGMEISGVGISDAVAVTFQDSGDTVTRNAHGLANDTRISFASITSTTGIAAYTYYYVINATANTFQVASSVGGSALPLTTNGSGTMLYGTTITAITPNTSITLSVPASASGTITTSSAVLKRSLARLKNWTVSG
jgi:hypothetical protein